MGSSLLLVDSSSQLSNLIGFALVLHWFLRVETRYYLLAPDMLTCMKIQSLLIQGLSPHRIFQCGKSSCKQERKAIS